MIKDEHISRIQSRLPTLRAFGPRILEARCPAGKSHKNVTLILRRHGDAWSLRCGDGHSEREIVAAMGLPLDLIEASQ